MNSLSYAHLIFDKVAKNTHGEKTTSSTNAVRKNCYPSEKN
jgi:hypothetical protein